MQIRCNLLKCIRFLFPRERIYIFIHAPFVCIGVIYVVDELDYEQKTQYELTVRATDSVSGIYAEVLVSILVLDVNDCSPEFTQDSYNISVSEALPFGSSVLKVTALDNDTGTNLVYFFWYN